MKNGNAFVGDSIAQEFETPLTENGQVTIPLEIRRLIGLHPGDKVRFEVEGGIVRITRATSNFLAGYKAVKRRAMIEDDKTIREEFEKGVAEAVISEAN
jgi:AbrB family looped-hinge helix DNA binding protein